MHFERRSGFLVIYTNGDILLLRSIIILFLVTVWFLLLRHSKVLWFGWAQRDRTFIFYVIICKLCSHMKNHSHQCGDSSDADLNLAFCTTVLLTHFLNMYGI